MTCVSGSTRSGWEAQMTPVERLLSTLPDVKQAGKGWSARCPAPEDRRASLSIAEGNTVKKGTRHLFAIDTLLLSRKISRSHLRYSLAILCALLFGLLFVGCSKPVNKPDMLLQSEKGSFTPRKEHGYTFTGTVPPRIAIPPEEDGNSVSVLERP